MKSIVWSVLLGLLMSAVPACSSYVTPGGPADLSTLGVTPQIRNATDASIQKLLDKKPLVTFPAAIATAHVQSADYESYTWHRHRRAGA